MAVKKPAERVVRRAVPLPPILVGARARVAGGSVEVWLTVFLRCVAVAWIGEGLLQWLAILTDDGGGLAVFGSPSRMAALFFFCVLDFVAAVGLWLVTTWGAAVWIATVAGHVFAPGFLPQPGIMLAGDVALVATYAALMTASARRERGR